MRADSAGHPSTLYAAKKFYTLFVVLWIGFDLQAEIEAVSGNNCTALHLADNGWTPLHLAAFYGKSSIANLLLQANASPTAVNKYGDTPAQDAKQYGHGNLAARLLEAEQAAALKLERIPLVTLPLL